MAQGLLIQLHHERGVPVLVVEGDLDLTSAEQLRTEGRELVDEVLAPTTSGAPGEPEPPEVVVLDASQVTFVDSAGLGALVSVLKRTLAHRAGFSIAGSGPHLRARLAQTGLDRVVALHDSAADAVTAATGTTSDTPPGTTTPDAGRGAGERAGSNGRLPDGGHRSGDADRAG